jgi:hypothetical protein
MRVILFGTIACLLVLVAPDLQAQSTCNAGGRYRVQLNPSVIDYGIVSSIDLDAGQILIGRMRVRVRPRRNDEPDWDLCLRANASAFGGGKLIEDVEWQVAGSPVWQPVSTAEQLVSQGSGTQRVDVLFRILVDWDDVPGDYSASLAFIASSQ